ncbi:MAG: hypothetical protein ABR497_01775 [Kiritimatiellia bacterium]|nr:hypothetical protein [Lentisphaerota bacterium]
MRPALLVVVMDFLVSSLLLFVSGPGDAESAGRIRSVAPLSQPAAEFAPAAMADMEQQWREQYRRQFQDMQALAQRSQLQEQSALLENERRQRRELEALRLQLERSREEEQRAARTLAEQVRAAEQKSAELIEDKTELEQKQSDLLAEQEQARAALQALAEERAALARQAVDLRDRLRLQAGAINAQHQTIASQQQVIDEALSDLNRMQVRLESKTDVLTGQHDRMQAMLRDMQQLVELLPGELQGQAREMAMEQQRLDRTVAELADALGAVRDELDLAGAERAAVQMEALAALQHGLQQEFRELLESGVDSGLQGELELVQQRQAELQSGISGLAGQLEEMQVRQAGPFSRLRDAYLVVQSGLASSREYEATGPHEEVYQNRVHVPLLEVNDGFWLVLHGRDMGLGWVAGLPFVQSGQWQALIGDQPLWCSDEGGAALLFGEPAVVRINVGELSEDFFASGRIRPMRLAGREQIIQRGTRDIFMVKRHADGAAFAVSVTPDQGHPSYLKVRRALRPWANFVARRIWSNPGNQAEPGDFLVTAEGEMVGVMVDDLRCWVLDEEDFGPAANPLPLTDLPTLWRMLAPLRRTFQ